MTDLRRTLLWVAFTMSLLMLWDRWHVFNGQPSMFSSRPAAVATSAKPGATGSSAAGAAAVNAAAAVAAAASGATPDVKSERVTFTTDVYKATIDTRGGEIVDLALLKYEQNDSHSELLAVVRRALGMHVEPPPEGNVEVFDTAPDQFYATQTGLTGGGATLPHHTTVMHLATAERTLANGQDTLVVRLESPDVNGVQLVKTYTFHRGSYAIGVSHEVLNHSTAPVSPQLYLQLVRDGRQPAGGYFNGPSSYTGPAVYRDGHFSKVAFSDIEKGKQKDAVDPSASVDNGWIAMIQHYFSSAWILPQGVRRSYSLAQLPPDANEGVSTFSVAMVAPVGTVAPGGSRQIDATLFAGPQEEHLLEPLAPGLEQVKDYGTFKIIAQPLFWLLDKLHTVIGNWGWSIVALVVCIKIAFYGLNASAYRSMAKMKAVGPRVQELRTRYKDNPQQMQQETMKIYREEKVNPLGGCFPILIQMPIFFALFTVLTSSAEMRGAPWILWIHDLSIMDPYSVLPVLMTLSSLALTAMNPTPPDPVQARMMWIMPLAFSVALFAFPAGLVLYWLSNNILTFAQQRLIQRQINGPKSGATEAKVVKAK